MRIFNAFLTGSVYLCISLAAEDAAPSLKKQKAALEKQYSELTRNIRKIENQFADDPEVKKATETSRKKRADMNEARESIYGKIAEKNPEFKSQYEQRNNLKARLEEVKDNSKTIQEALDQNQKDSKKLYTEHPELQQLQSAERSVERSANDFRANEKVMESASALAKKEQELGEAQEAFYTEIAKIDPRFKTYLDRRNKLKEETAEDAAKLEEFSANYRKAQAAIAKLQEVINQNQKSSREFVTKHPELERAQYADRNLERSAREYKDKKELKAFAATPTQKKEELEKSKEGFYTAVAKVSPRFKTYLDQRNKLREETAEIAVRAQEFRTNYRKGYTDIRKLRNESNELQRSIPQAEKGYYSAIRNHRNDTDLKELFEVSNTKQQEYNEASSVPGAIIAEKDPEYKALLDKRAELQAKYNELRKAMYGTKGKQQKPRKDKAKTEGKTKTEGGEPKKIKKVKLPPKPKTL
jgi:chromosome segregation ATPase